MGVSVAVSDSVLPAPSVEILVDDIPAGVDTFTVTRTAAGRTFRVRGLVGALAAGGASQRDYEAPFEVPLTYQAEWFTAGLSVGFSDPTTITLPGLDAGRAWFHDPLTPDSSVCVQLLNGAAAEIVRSSESDSLSVPRRSVGFVLPGTRGGVSGVVLDSYTETREDSERFDALFGGYDSDSLSIVCVRTLPETWLPPTLFAYVGSPAQRPLGTDGESVYWALTGDETTPPAPAFITPLLTYADFTAFYDSYADFADSYGTYLDASRDYGITT